MPSLVVRRPLHPLILEWMGRDFESREQGSLSPRARPHVQVQASDLVCSAVVAAAREPARPVFLRPALPAFHAVLPLCALPGNGHHALQGVDLLRAPSTRLYARQQGRNLTMELPHRGAAGEACRCREAARGGLALRLRVSAGGCRCCCPIVHVRGLAIGGCPGPLPLSSAAQHCSGQ